MIASTKVKLREKLVKLEGHQKMGLLGDILFIIICICIYTMCIIIKLSNYECISDC